MGRIGTAIDRQGAYEDRLYRNLVSDTPPLVTDAQVIVGLFRYISVSHEKVASRY